MLPRSTRRWPSCTRPTKQVHSNLGYRISSVNGSRFFTDAGDVNGSLVSSISDSVRQLLLDESRPGLIWKAEYNYFDYGEGGRSGAQYCNANPNLAVGTTRNCAGCGVQFGGEYRDVCRLADLRVYRAPELPRQQRGFGCALPVLTAASRRAMPGRTSMKTFDQPPLHFNKEGTGTTGRHKWPSGLNRRNDLLEKAARDEKSRAQTGRESESGVMQ